MKGSITLKVVEVGGNRESLHVVTEGLNHLEVLGLLQEAMHAELCHSGVEEKEPLASKPSKLFSYEARTGVDDCSYYQLVSPSGIRLNLHNADKDTPAFIEEANATIRERTTAADKANPTSYAVVDTDNFASDYPDEKFVLQGLSKETAEQAAKYINDRLCRG